MAAQGMNVDGCGDDQASNQTRFKGAGCPTISCPWCYECLLLLKYVLEYFVVEDMSKVP